MKRHWDRPLGEDLVYTAVEQECPDCERVLPVFRARERWVEGLEHRFRLVRRDKRCGRACSGTRPVFFAHQDLRVVLPGRIYGLDLTLHVGERHLRDGLALAQITRDLHARGLPVDQRHTGRIFRDFLALASLARGDDAQTQQRLRDQGGLVLMVDGVQFDDRAPVLYLVWDALHGTPLFGERKPFRGENDLVPLLQRVKAMNVPLLGIVTDKEKGLVPAVQTVFPDVPYQFCQTHFLKNCAKPLQPDLRALGESVARRADRVRDLEKKLAHRPTPAPVPSAPPASPHPPSGPVVAQVAQDVVTSTPSAAPPKEAPALTEQDLAREVCELVRANSRVSDKAPLAPPELERHERLEAVRALVNEARGKKVRRAPVRASGRCSANSPPRWT